MAWGPGITKTSASIPRTISSITLVSTGCAAPVDLLTPDMTLYTANLQEFKSKKEPLEQIYWLSHDSTARGLTYKSITSCNNLCNQELSFDPNTPIPSGCSFTDYY